jgi:hypothetical protein
MKNTTPLNACGSVEKLTMLYQNDSTHEKSLIAVEPYTEAEIAARNGFRPELKLFHPAGEMEQVLCNPGQIGIRVDPNTLLDGLCGTGVIITEAQARTLRELTADIRSLNSRKKTPEGPSIANGECCYSCGRVRKSRRGDCPYCGADAL